MSDRLKSEAELLELALEVGATSVSDVVAWADAVIAAEERPHWSVCELATMGARNEHDVVQALRAVPGAADPGWVRAELVGRLAKGLAEDHRRADRIPAALHLLAAANDDELRSLAWWAAEALDLADQRLVPETREDVIAQMLIALQDAASKSHITRS